MVLRKPYGFLIKHFKLIHLIIAFILSYIVYKYRSIYIFLGNCINNSANRYDAFIYIDYKILIYIFIVLILLFIVNLLLRYKDKPRNIYIMSLLGYIVLGVILVVVFNYLNGFNVNIIDQKDIRLYRDILFICDLFQYYIIIIMFIRGLGFDIKKFNFAKDAQELNLSQEDVEEIEVNIGLDTTNIVRGVRKQKREFGYFFKEYKIYIISIIIILLLFLGYKIYNYFDNKYKIYNENEYVGDNKYINITNSYYDKIDNNNYIIIKFKTVKNGINDRLNTGNIVLSILDKRYVPDKNICYKYNDMGNCYKQQYITSVEEEYILVYKIDELEIDKSYILYGESYENTYKVKLNLKNIKSD